MKKSLVLAMAMALGVTATAFAANPFSDVPAGHWAYASVAKLAAAGIVDGYPDGTFGGDDTMTRYEMAQIVAKALAKGAIGADDKLVAEFASELDNLGVRVAKLEKNSDNVKITGQVRARYVNHKRSGVIDGKAFTNSHTADLRTRLYLSGAINDDWSYGAMVQNEQDLSSNAEENSTDFKEANVRGHFGAVKVIAGRWNETVGAGNVYDDRLDGLKLSTNFGKLDAGIVYGRPTLDKDDLAKLEDGKIDMVIGTLGYQFGVVAANAAYYHMDAKIDKQAERGNIWTVGVDIPFGKDFTFGAEYLKGSEDDLAGNNSGYVLGVSYAGAEAAKKGTWGAWAKYYDQAESTFLVHTTDAWTGEDGFKGFGIGANYTVAKNIVANVAYYDTKDKKDSDIKDKTIWTDLTFTF